MPNNRHKAAPIAADTFPLHDLPAELLMAVVNVAPKAQATQMKVALSKTCCFFRTTFQEGLEKEALAKALRHAALATDEDVKALEAMLAANPSLLLISGKVITRGGYVVKDVTIYEFLLGAGDPDFAGKVADYFKKLDNGEEERIKQYAKYQPAIYRMLTQAPYDLTNLINIIKASSAEEITEALQKNWREGSELTNALNEFKEKVSVKTITKPQMHYNYQTLIYACDLFDREWDNLKEGNNYDKCRLVWRQVIGYLQRDLPAVDRFAFAQDIYELVENKKNFNRETKYVYDKNGSFPDSICSDSSSGGLGFDYGIYGGGLWRGVAGGGDFTRAAAKTYVEQKLQAYKTYAAAPIINTEPEVCNRLR